MRSHSTPAGLFIGLTTFDLVHYVECFPRADEKIQAQARWTGAGGPAANAAAAFAALGGKARLLTAIGDGPLANAAAEDLVELGVEVVDLVSEGELPTSSAVVDKSGQRTVVSLNAKGFDQEAMVRRLPEMQAIDVVVVDAHYPALVDSALSEVSDQRVPVVIDPGSDKPHVFDLMAKCDHVIASRSLDPSVDAAALLERIAEDGAALTAVSAGSQSILTAIGDRRSALPVPQVTARDSVGAGDILHGAYAYFVAIGYLPLDALDRAAGIAAESCGRHGARVDSDHEAE